MKRLAAVLLLVLSGCRPGPLRHTREWSANWSSLASIEAAPRPGDRWVLATHEGTPSGTRTTRESWTVLEVRDGNVHVAYANERGGQRETWLPLHPRLSLVLAYGGVSRRGPHPLPRDFQTVRVPAGSFRCGETWRTHELSSGPIMHVEEWWAPNVPVPVQRWTVWSGNREQLREPPRSPDRVPIGTTWCVLERAARH